jgi:serine protease SohB
MCLKVKKFRKEVTAVVSAADPERGDSVVVLINSGGGTVNGYGLAAAQLERVKVGGSNYLSNYLSISSLLHQLP